MKRARRQERERGALHKGKPRLRFFFPPLHCEPPPLPLAPAFPPINLPLARERRRQQNSAAGAMAPVKADELVPFPVKEQFGGLDYCITSPPPWSPFCFYHHYSI
jgi:hypothetical protein